MSDLSDVPALTFDIFGTTIDWRPGVAAEGQRLERPMEKGPSGGADSLPDPLADVQAADFVDLASRLVDRLRSEEPA